MDDKDSENIIAKIFVKTAGKNYKKKNMTKMTLNCRPMRQLLRVC